MPKRSKFNYKELRNLCMRETLGVEVLLAKAVTCMFAWLGYFWTVLFREFPFLVCYLLTSASTKNYDYLYTFFYQRIFLQGIQKETLVRWQA